MKDEEQNTGEENKKRRIECTDTENNGVHSEFQRAHTESMSEFQVSGELPLSKP